MSEDHTAEKDAHRLVHNGPDALDTCTGCDWESWDTAPTFADHLTRVLPPGGPDA